MNTNFFNKQEYTEEDINTLISNNVEESLTLEFKRAEAIENKKEISKDVSAMANSAGGILIYGIEEIDNKAGKLSFIDGEKYTIERLDQVISSNITRRIPNLKIHSIRFGDDFKKTVYLLKIPESVLGPHMVNNRYFKRSNSRTNIMEEYEVRNLYFKAQKTILKINTPSFKINDPLSFGEQSLQFVFSITNEGNMIEKDFKLEVKIKKEIYEKLGYFENSFAYKECGIAKYLVETDKEYLRFVVPNTAPIFQNETMKISDVFISKNILKDKENSKEEDDDIIIKLYYTNGIVEEKYSVFKVILI